MEIFLKAHMKAKLICNRFTDLVVKTDKTEKALGIAVGALVHGV